MITLRISSCVLLGTSSEMRRVCQNSVRGRVSKADRIKILMTEVKSVFGDLLETNKEKKRRLKLEKKGKIPVQKKNKKDTEYSWVMKHSPNNLKRIIVPAKILNEHEDSSWANSIKSPKNCSTVTLDDKIPANQNAENTFYSESSQSTQTITPETTSQSKLVENSNSHDTSLDSNATDVKNAVTKCSNISEKFFDIVIKNIPSFSIVGNRQKISAELTEMSTSTKNDLKTTKFPSVTKVLTYTMSPESKQALEAWKERMIKQLGQEGFNKYQRALLNDGSILHACIARNLLGKEYEIPPRIQPVFKSVQSILENMSNVKAIETHVAHPKLRYKGIVDCVASYRGENYVIDWKKSDKKKLSLTETYDAPVQVAAYIGAINASNTYPFVIKRGLIVIAYTSGDPAMVYEVCDDTLQKYWTMWLRRLQQYYVETASSDDNTSNKTLI